MVGVYPVFPPSPLPHPRVQTSSIPLPVSPLCWLLFVEGVWFCLRPVRSISPLLMRASDPSLPSCAHAFSLSSLSLFPLCVLPASSAACPVRSRAQHWHTAPNINSTHRCKRPCKNHISQSCTSTWAHIFSRHQRLEKLIVLVSWCEPPAPSPPPSPLSPPQSLLIGSSNQFVHHCL